MCYLSNICCLCLKDINILPTVYLNRTEDSIKQINYVLPEITLEPEIPARICSTCHTKLHSFCTFKKQCLENYYRFIEKLRESGNAKDESFNPLPIETMYIKQEIQVDDDLINEASEGRNSHINCITNEVPINAMQDETITPGLNKNINEVSGMADHITSSECEEQHDQTNNFIEDNIYINKDINKFEDREEPNLYQKLLTETKKKIDNEEDINKIKIADLNINNLERTVSNLIISSDLNQKINESEFNSHIKIKSKKDYQCSICEKKFTVNNSLKLHMKSHTGVKDFQCSICEKKFMQKSSLNVHMKTHTGVKEFQCFICEKKFIRNSQLKRHMKTHTGVKDFQCSICEKKFIQNSDMKLHMKTHTDVKDFHCSICEKKFTLNNSLKMHMKTHSAVKDFQCSICEKKFTQQCSLNLHMKTHTGVKDFQCSICDKKFTQNNHMKQHIKTHIGVKDFQCSICEKKFTQQCSLNLHMKTHTGVRDFQCSICEKKFIRNSHLKLHMKKHTGV